MKLKLFILVSIIMLSAFKVYAQDGHDTISCKYFPLQVGNFWMYKTIKSNSINPTQIEVTNQKSFIEKDTLMNGTVYFKINISADGYPTISRYYRYDSLTANLMCYYNNPPCIEEIALRLGLNPGDSVAPGNWCGIGWTNVFCDDSTVFNINTNYKKYSWNSYSFGYSTNTNFSLYYGIGRVDYVHHSATHGGSNTERTILVGCRINGIVYGDTTLTSITQTSSQVSEFNLSQNYPNPFNPVTKISFSVPKNSFVSLNVYNILGQNIETLVNQNMSTGSYEAEWKAWNYPSGVYFYKLETENFSEVKKMVLKK